ncbi:MAG: SBBP repeat-containing protein, partial [Candidatus Hodarchaeota archaeon]
MIVFRRDLSIMLFICLFSLLSFSVHVTISQDDSVIDPVDLTYSTYFGGSSWDAGVDIATDAANNIIICGNTNSSDFPTTSDAYKSNYSDS